MPVPRAGGGLPPGFQLPVKAPRGLTHAQLHPGHRRDDARLDHFLGLLPGWMRVAVELRHPSWHDEGVVRLLERHGAAYRVMSGARLPCVLRATAPFVYVRIPDHLYAGSCSGSDLDWWASRVGEWRDAGLDVFAYFNNDGHGHAVRDAEGLRARTG